MSFDPINSPVRTQENCNLQSAFTLPSRARYYHSIPFTFPPAWQGFIYHLCRCRHFPETGREDQKAVDTLIREHIPREKAFLPHLLIVIMQSHRIGVQQPSLRLLFSHVHVLSV